MNTAFEPYEEYIQWLAEGRLDSYLDSVRVEDKISPPNICIPNDVSLLLHEVGKHPDEDRIKNLFIEDNMFVAAHPCIVVANYACSSLFNTTGTGKTRLSLEGLCCHWGIYITCESYPSFGSSDFSEVTAMFTSSSTWDPTDQKFWQKRNIVNRPFAMLLCARLFIFKQLLTRIPLQTDVKTARRRWVLLQSLPGRYSSVDIFVHIFRSLRSLLRFDIYTIKDLIYEMLGAIAVERGDLFSMDQLAPLFSVVIDEAQVAASGFKESFRSYPTETEQRPILHAMHRYLRNNRLVREIILAGTGLSTDMVEHMWGVCSAKRMGPGFKLYLFSDTPRFHANLSQDAYLRRYLILSDDDVSDRRLRERIHYWLSGRFVSSIIRSYHSSLMRKL